MGNPLDLSTQVGPITTRPQYEKVLEYLRVGKDEGAVCRLGGGPATRPECGSGWFVEPTVFTNVRPDMRIANEEIFGPVLSIIPFDDEDEAVRIANSTVYGLAAGVWTSSIRRALSMSERLEAGTVWIEYVPDDQLYVAFRRIQTFRPRPRKRYRRHPRLSANEERLDRHNG